MVDATTKILNYLQTNEQEILQDLEEFVKKESPSRDKALVDECGHYLQELFQKHLDVTPEVFTEKEVGNHLKFTIGDGEKQILIIGHFDTVWEKGRLSYRVEGNKAYGPGILDMKGGMVQAIWAVKAIRELGMSMNKKIVFLCNSDEEIGSIHSRKYIEEEARKSEVALVAEAAVAKTGALKTARKGVGIFKLKVWGRAAHSGNHHHDGISAIEELARQTIFLQELTDYEKGSTVNVGVVKGGTGSNVVPEYAEADIDLRISSLEEAERVSALILGLKPILDGTKIKVTGEVNRPPMERTEEIGKLFHTAQVIASELGFELDEAAVGGGSDGNFTAALGIPTLDGLGCEGEGLHAENEHVLINTLSKRAALLANLLLRI